MPDPDQNLDRRITTRPERSGDTVPDELRSYRLAATEAARAGSRTEVLDEDGHVVAEIVPAAPESSDRSEDPAVILAVAEDERHTLMTQETRDHLSRMEAEIRRHQKAMAHIETVFRSRTAAQITVPEWVTVNRKADIAQALHLVDAASQDDTARLIAQAGLTATPGHFRRTLAGAASEPAKVYPAWLSATAFLKAAGLY